MGFGPLLKQLIEGERRRADTLWQFEALAAAMAICTATNLEFGPMARRGARSHRSWRLILAQEKRRACALHVTAATGYFAIARGDA